MTDRRCEICGCTDDKACRLESGRPCDWIDAHGAAVCSNPKCVRLYHLAAAANTIEQGQAIQPVSKPETIAFFVDGKPKPGGSKTAMPVMSKGRPVMARGRPLINMVDAASTGSTESKAAYKAWRLAVSTTARLIMGSGSPPIIEPVEVSVWFFVKRPKGDYGTGRNANTLKASAPAVPITKPDATKLWRLAEDCLTGIVWTDDNQVVDQNVHKRYAIAGRTGMAIVIQPLVF